MNIQFLSTAVLALLLVACESSTQDYSVVGELSSDRVEITAEFAEPITAIAVAEGAEVAAGDVLVEQDASRAEARLREADAALGQVRARLDELVRGPRSEQIAAARANVEGANQELDFRQSELERVREIHARGLASAELLDQAQAALDGAQASLKFALAQLEERLAGTTVEELAQAEQAVQQAIARRDAAAVDLQRHTLRAPIDGVADSRLFETGERPVPGQPVIVMLAAGQPHARVYVPEALRVRVAAGTPARIRVDGLEEPIEGRVRWVSSEAAFTPYYALTERDRGRLTYLAKVDLITDRDRLPDGVPVEVELLVGETR
jgi:HlyD family secretion protein